MDSVRVEIDDNRVMAAINKADDIKPALKKLGTKIADQANVLGAGYRTPKWHDHDTGETKGGKQPKYGATLGNRQIICIVHPENYAAMKDNYLHNTMLKARG